MLAQASGDAVAWRRQVAPHSSARFDTGLILAQSSVTALGAGSDNEASRPFDRAANTEALEGRPRALQIPLLRRTDRNISQVPTRLQLGRIERLRQQAIGLFLDHGIAFATQLFQAGPVQHRDPPTSVADDPELLQLARSFGDTFTAHPEHVRD